MVILIMKNSEFKKKKSETEDSEGTGNFSLTKTCYSTYFKLGTHSKCFTNINSLTHAFSTVISILQTEN